LNSKEIEKYLSKARVSRYTNHHNKENDGLAIFDKHNYNIELTLSFSRILAYLEIGLRNYINDSLSQIEPTWLMKNDFLLDYEINKVNKIKKLLKARNKEINQDNIVSKLDFGFYAKLFDSKYEKIIWHRIIKNVFPNLNSSLQKRKFISQKVLIFKSLRNKIAHHEQISDWDNLNIYHDEIIEFIGWMSKDMKKQILKGDKFYEIFEQKAI
jgi:hypothetical protein